MIDSTLMDFRESEREGELHKTVVCCNLIVKQLFPEIYQSMVSCFLFHLYYGF